MAKLTLAISGDVSDVQSKIGLVKTNLENIENTPIKIKIEASGLDAVTKDMISYVKSTAQANAAEAKLEQQRAKTAAATARQAVAEAKTAAQREKTNQATQRRMAEEAKLATQMEKTATAEEQARTANVRLETQVEKTATAEANLAVQQERTNTAMAQTALQEERTATASRNLEIQQERTNTAMARGAASAGSLASTLENYLIRRAISAAIQSLEEAVSTMKDVDTELTNIQKVSNLTSEEIKRIGDAAYDTASKYGVAADEYLSAVYTFQKAGLGDSAEEMAELATKTMLVGDTTAAVASKFLVAVNAAWGLNGSISELSRVVDEADFINNNYATDLATLSEGMPIVASTAANFGMTLEETMAALGTITARTQESGSKAATALRALIMNIQGEVGTLADGTGEHIEVTIEDIERLSDALRIYGNEAVQTAQKEGTVIDPMEVLRSLAQAYRDDLLNDQELMEILMETGGKLRTNQLSTLVKDMASDTSTYYDILSKLPEAAGTADAEVSTMLSSWESKTQILKNTWTEFLTNFISTDGIKAALDVLTDIIEALDTTAGKITVITALLGALGAAAALNPVTAGFAAAAGAVGLLLAALGNAKTAQEEYNKTLRETYPELYKLQDALDGFNGSVKESEDNLKLSLAQAGLNADLAQKYIEQMEGEAEQIGKTGEATDTYSAALRNLVGIYPELNDYIDDETGLLGVQGEELDGLISKWNAYAEAQAYAQRATELYYERIDLKAAYDTAKEGADGNLASIRALESQIAAVTDRMKELKSAYADEAGVFGENTPQEVMYEYGMLSEVTLPELADNLDSAKEAQKGYNESLADAESKLNAVDDQIAEITGQYSEAADAVAKAAESTNGFAESVDNAADSMSKAQGEAKTLADLMTEVENGLDEEADAATNAAMQTQFYALQAALASGQPIDTAGAISSLSGLSAQSTNTAAALAALMAVFKQIDALDATISKYTALEAESTGIMAGRYETLLTDLIASRAGFDVGGVFQREYANELAKLQGTGTGGGGGGGGSSSKDAALEAYKDIVSLEKQRLSYMEASGASAEEQVSKMREIQDALHDEAEYLRSINGDEEDIVKLSTEWWSYQSKIEKLLKETDDSLDGILKLRKQELSLLEASEADTGAVVEKMRQIQALLEQQIADLKESDAYLTKDLDTLTQITQLQTEWYSYQSKIDSALKKEAEETEKAAEEALEAAKEQALAMLGAEEEAAKGPLQEQLELLEAQKKARESAREEEERLLAVEKARIALENAQNERNVRQYNAQTGQWEWVANAETVAKAQEALEDAEKALADFYVNREIEMLKEQIESIESAYSKLRANVESYADAVRNGTVSYAEAMAYFTAVVKGSAASFKGSFTAGTGGTGGSTRTAEQERQAYIDSEADEWTKLSTSRGSAVEAYRNERGVGDYYVNKARAVAAGQSSDEVIAILTGGVRSGQISTEEAAQTLEEIAARSGIQRSREKYRELLEAADDFKAGVYDGGGILRGRGGIKATTEDEIVLPPGISKAMLNAQRNGGFEALLNSMGIVTAAANSLGGFGGGVSRNSIGVQNNGDTYQLGGITISESQARGMTVYDLAQMARGLSLRSS